MGCGSLCLGFAFSSQCLSRAWKHKESSWHPKMWNLGCPTDKKIILLQTQAFWRRATCWGDNAVQVWGAKAALCLWLCTHCPQPAPCYPCMGSLHSLHPCCCIAQVCQHPCTAAEGVFAPAVTPLALVSKIPQTQCLILQLWPWCASHPRQLQWKLFLVNFHCISTPIPKNFLSTQWGFG